MCDEVAVLAHPPNMATSLSEVLTYENPPEEVGHVID